MRSPAEAFTPWPSHGSVKTYPPRPHAMPCDALQALRPRPSDDVAGLDRPQLQELHHFLLLTRRLEEVLVALFRQNQVIGGVYRSLGQEATAVGCAYAMQDGDYVQPLIRDLGAALVHGVKPEAVLMQYMARRDGPTGGRDLNVHFSCPKRGLVGPTSMLGAGIPVVAGCLLAARHFEERKAGLCFIGDGGSSTGAFYEAVNFAAVQRLPLIVVIEANQFAYSTPTSQQLPGGDLLARARGFGCVVAEIDGNDVLACYEGAQQARARGLRGEGPTLLVAHTYRRRGHAEHDNQHYLARADEPQRWAEQNDPLQRFVTHLQRGKHLDAAHLSHAARAVDALLDTARELALDSPVPDPHSQSWGVWDDGQTPWPEVSSWFGAGPRHRKLLEQG